MTGVSMNLAKAHFLARMGHAESLRLLLEVWAKDDPKQALQQAHLYNEKSLDPMESKQGRANQKAIGAVTEAFILDLRKSGLVEDEKKIATQVCSKGSSPATKMRAILRVPRLNYGINHETT